MGTLAASVIIDKVAQKLLDDTKVRFTAGELLGDYNFVLKAIVNAKPDAYVKNAPFTLAAGCKQSLPNDAAQFKRARQWLGAAGNVPGNSIVQIDRDDLDATVPNWQTTSGSSVRHFVVDDTDKLAFFVFPQVAAGQILIEYFAIPPEAANPASIFPLADNYATAQFYGMMAWAHSKNSKVADVNRASYWMGLFNSELGVKAQIQEFSRTRGAAAEQAKERT